MRERSSKVDSIIPNLTQIRNSLEDLLIQQKRIADALDVMVAPQREKLAAERAAAEVARREVAVQQAATLQWDEFLKYLKAWLPRERAKFLFEVFSAAELDCAAVLFEEASELYSYWLDGETKKRKQLVRASFADLSKAAKNVFGKPLKYK
jgi:hypothetical protein